jgi:WD40 repeat protein
MENVVSCSCGQKLSVTGLREGAWYKCPKCRQRFQTPPATLPAAAPTTGPGWVRPLIAVVVFVAVGVNAFLLGRASKPSPKVSAEVPPQSNNHDPTSNETAPASKPLVAETKARPPVAKVSERPPAVPKVECTPIGRHESMIRKVGFSAKGNQIISVSASGSVAFWDVQDPSKNEVLRTNLRISSAALSTDGKRALFGATDNSIRLWDLEKRAEVATLKGHTDVVTALAFTPDGQRAASGSWDKSVRLWNLADATGQPRHLKGHNEHVNDVAFSPDGSLLASAGDDATIRLWDTANGGQLHELKGHELGVCSLAFTPDGRRLFSGGEDGTIFLWDAREGTRLKSFNHLHNLMVSCLACSPDGKRLLSGSWDMSLRLWDIESAKEIGSLERQEFFVQSLAFAPSQDRAASGGGGKPDPRDASRLLPTEGTVRLWTISQP